jgi:hypothetical protein
VIDSKRACTALRSNVARLGNLLLRWRATGVLSGWNAVALDTLESNRLAQRLIAAGRIDLGIAAERILREVAAGYYVYVGSALGGTERKLLHAP